MSAFTVDELKKKYAEFKNANKDIPVFHVNFLKKEECVPRVEDLTSIIYMEVESDFDMFEDRQ